MSNAEIDQVTLIFEGRVQGVGFRATVRQFALECGLSGSAQNLSDGSVKVIAQGTKAQFETLIKKLQERFHITHVTTNFSKSQKKERGFSIL